MYMALNWEPVPIAVVSQSRQSNKGLSAPVVPMARCSVVLCRSIGITLRLCGDGCIAQTLIVTPVLRFVRPVHASPAEICMPP